MPDLRQKRKDIKKTMAIMLGIDVVAAAILLSPLVGSTSSRRQQLNDLWTELQTKTRQVEPLKNLPQKVVIARQQISDFYKKRFPSQQSEIASEFGKLAAADGVTIAQVHYKSSDVGAGQLEPIEMEADLSGNYSSLAKFINALERDEMFFIINSVKLGGEEHGPIKLNVKIETYVKVGS